MVTIDSRIATVPVYRTQEVPVSTYRNLDTSLVIPSNALISNINTRQIHVEAACSLPIFTTDKYAISLKEGSTARFFLDATSVLSIPSVIDTVNIFNSSKDADFFILHDNTTSLPLVVTVDLFDVPSIIRLKPLLDNPAVMQIYLRTDSGYRAVTYDLLLSVKDRNKPSIRIELTYDFLQDIATNALINLKIKATDSKLRKLSHIITDSELAAITYNNHVYRRARNMKDLSKTGYFFYDSASVYLTSIT